MGLDGLQMSAIEISYFEASFTMLVTEYLLGSQIKQNKTCCPQTPIKGRLEFLVPLSPFWISKELPFGEKIMSKRSPVNQRFHMALLCWFSSTGLQVIRKSYTPLKQTE